MHKKQNQNPIEGSFEELIKALNGLKEANEELGKVVSELRQIRLETFGPDEDELNEMAEKWKKEGL